mmetsp:Transcript_124037/g.214979  ORF Transcript_124037/g.214979 Transcript_124037/m.214979 type:complete len:232 (-) Transcript_124037:9-704(-)
MRPSNVLSTCINRSVQFLSVQRTGSSSWRTHLISPRSIVPSPFISNFLKTSAMDCALCIRIGASAGAGDFGRAFALGLWLFFDHAGVAGVEFASAEWPSFCLCSSSSLEPQLSPDLEPRRGFEDTAGLVSGLWPAPLPCLFGEPAWKPRLVLGRPCSVPPFFWPPSPVPGRCTSDAEVPGRRTSCPLRPAPSCGAERLILERIIVGVAAAAATYGIKAYRVTKDSALAGAS